MGVYSGPDLKEDGLVLALDGANYKSFKGQSATNLYYIEAGSSANNSIFYMPMGGTATGSHTTSHSYGSWSGNTIFKVTVSSGTLAGGYESFRTCVSSSFDSTYGTTRRLSAKVKMLKGSITSLSYHTGGGTGGHTSSHYTPISESSVPTDVLSKDGWYQFDMDVSGSYPYGHCVGIGIVGSDIEFLVTEMMLYPSSTFVRFTPTTRGSTVATGGGWADLSGRVNHGELLNGVREDSANGGSLVFDGSNDHILTTSVATYGNNTTWEAWIYCTGNVSTYNMFMGRYLPYFGFYGGNSLFFSNNIGGSQRTIQTATNLSYNTWYHATFTTYYDGVNTTMKIYTNGVETASGVFAGTQGNYGYKFMIGDGNAANDGSSAWYPFQGRISNVKVYNRNLSASEIQQNFNANRARFGI